MSGQISLSEVKYAIADLLLEEIGLPAQSLVNAIESAGSLQAVKAIVVDAVKKPILSSRPQVIAQLRAIFAKS